MSENRQGNEAYTYTYSARQQAEIKAIRQKYLPPKEDKMALLRRLDRSTSRRGNTWALSLGIVSCLMMGVGMSCVLVWGDRWFIPGIFIGLAGIAGMALAYPVYTFITRREREKVAPDILRLTEELLEEHHS